eukprot:GHVU01186811.1.p1 GENE.GHVU01186811.1~~GHVU01186811.1.p1  ORF type:complete len:145 (+),score=9.68 GHVU01186811.1:1010-1444(+)
MKIEEEGATGITLLLIGSRLLPLAWQRGARILEVARCPPCRSRFVPSLPRQRISSALFTSSSSKRDKPPPSIRIHSFLAAIHPSVRPCIHPPIHIFHGTFFHGLHVRLREERTGEADRRTIGANNPAARRAPEFAHGETMNGDF